MCENTPDVLEVLKTEFVFLKLGGYSLRSALTPEFIFEDAPTCINCGREDRIPCTDCVLIQFVPPEHRSEKIACRHIPLKPSGETLDSLYRYGNAQEVEEAVGDWLRATIERLEQERSAHRRPAGRRVSYPRSRERGRVLLWGRNH